MPREVLSLPAPPPDLQIPYGPCPDQFAEVRMPPGRGPHPVALLIHGGFWRPHRNLTYMGNVAVPLTAHGIATYNVEYRRDGYPHCLDDVLAAAAKLQALAREYPLDLRRIAAIGHSAGGQLALWLAGEMKLSAVFALGGAVDLRRAFELNLGDGAAAEFIGGSPEQYPERYRHASPSERLPLRTPVTLIHGDRDDIVPIELAERYHRAAAIAGDDCRLIRLPADHFDVVDVNSAVWPAILASIREAPGLR